ncbi:MAG TPA: hypothetical protein DHV28_11930 [Ignavibacteriales bacterium]|nr:hypothetical protein [Ignavibacteriales bacterium]
MKTHLKLFLNIILFILLWSTLDYSQNFQQLIRFPFQDSAKVNYCQSQPLILGNEILIFFSANKSPQDTILFTRSSDNGQNWSVPFYVASLERESDEMLFISGAISSTGRLLIVFSIGETPVNNKTKIVRTDDNGFTWSEPQNVIGTAYIPYPKITQTTDGKLWIVGRNNYFFYSTDDGNTWLSKNLGFSTSAMTAFDLVSFDSLNYIMTYDKYDSSIDKYKIYSRKSTDSGNSWSSETVITETESSEKLPRLLKESSGVLWLVSQQRVSTPFSPVYNIYQQNISYRKSTDNGITWNTSNSFTNYLGFDGAHNIFNYNDKPLITFLSDRWYGKNQIWIGQIEVSQDIDNPPVLYGMNNSNITVGIPISIRAFVASTTGIQNTELLYEKNNISYGPYPMFDDGNHDDGVAGDNIWGISIGPFNYYDVINTSIIVTDNNSLTINFAGIKLNLPPVPIINNWLSAGSLHNWYSSIGSEVEEGFFPSQQYGLQWNAIAPYQDIQASKGLWIGATNFTDQNGDFFPYKVVHTGPRVSGSGQFFPTEFKMKSKFVPSIVFVNGNISKDKNITIDEIDPNLFADRFIINRVNTQLGVTMTRKIFQFSQSYNDNYIISEYTFKNTGNVDGDSLIELPNTTLEGLYFYYMFRNAVCANVRNVIGNATSWGINSMLDTRGDGVMNDPPGEDFRAQYMWHGKLPSFTMYDNIGGPIWYPALNVDPEDTVGRLGASQFAGVVTLHADVSAENNSDDLSQPKTTSWEGSDEPLTTNNDPYDIPKMTQEYTSWITRGHKSPRHAYAVEPSGLPGFLQPTNDPALGTPGGFTFTNGYGPYTLAPGDSVTIVFAEAVSGISRELATSTGIQYKQGQINALQKNTIVFQSRDSLFQTFRNAIENYQSDYQIPQPPKPALTFNVSSDSIHVTLSWTIDELSPPENFRVYRSSGRRYNTPILIAELPSTSRSFVDTILQAGTDYYYYLSCVSPYQQGGPATPPGRLESSRFYTQTYNPVNVSVGTSVNDDHNIINAYSLSQNYPNPFNPSTSIIFTIPVRSNVNLSVYNVLGQKVSTLINNDLEQGKYSINFSGNELASGIYFYILNIKDRYFEVKKMLLLK